MPGSCSYCRTPASSDSVSRRQQVVAENLYSVRGHIYLVFDDHEHVDVLDITQFPPEMGSPVAW